MPEVIRDLIIAAGGGATVVIGIFTVFKGLMIKLFEKGIESSFEKSLVKFKNNIERSTRAYDILLNREMRFYEKLEPIIAELVPLEHDLLYYLQDDNNIDRKSQCESSREKFKRYSKLIIDLKNESLIHQSYIPEDVFHAFSSIVNQMQNDLDFWFEGTEHLFAGEYDKIDYNKGEAVINRLLAKLTIAQTLVRSRLEKLSGVE